MTDAGLELDVREPARDELPREPGEFDGVVCLGGAMSVHDVDEHPWLLRVQRLLAEATSARVPTLAICLGAQLLAVALGGRVKRADRPEVGPGLVSKRDAAWEDPLFGGLPLLPDVLQFHRDTITDLPARAVLLASGSESTNQAFRVDHVAYGIQFHIETTAETVAEWGRQAPELASWARSGKFDADVLDELHRDLEDAWQPVVAAFADLVTGSVAPARSRDLPLG